MNEQVAPSPAVVSPLAGNLWLWWVGAHLGGGLVASFLFAGLAAISGAEAGLYIPIALLLLAGIAVGQGLILHHFLTTHFAWLVWARATLMGAVLGSVILVVGTLATLPFPHVVEGPMIFLGWPGVLAGMVFGLAQWRVLARSLPHARALWWIPANSLALIVAFLAAGSLTAEINSLTGSWLIFTGVFGLLTGLVLQWLLRAAPAPA